MDDSFSMLARVEGRGGGGGDWRNFGDLLRSFFSKYLSCSH